MTQELQLALAEIINTALKATETAVNFLQAELPDVVIQLLFFNTIWNWFWVILPIVFAGLAMWAGFYGRKRYKATRSEEHCILAVFGFVFSGFFSVIALLNLKAALLITLAPKIWLLEYASKLLKG